MTDARDRTPGPGADEASEPLEPAAPRFGIVHVLAAATAILGASMIVRSLAAGGGLGSVGVLIGAFFVAAGVMRIRLISVRNRR